MYRAPRKLSETHNKILNFKFNCSAIENKNNYIG